MDSGQLSQWRGVRDVSNAIQMFVKPVKERQRASSGVENLRWLLYSTSSTPFAISFPSLYPLFLLSLSISVSSLPSLTVYGPAFYRLLGELNRSRQERRQASSSQVSFNMSSYGETIGAAAEPIDTDDGSSLSSLESLSPLFDDGRNGFMPHLEPSAENPDPVSEMLYADSSERSELLLDRPLPAARAMLPDAIGAGAVEMGWVEANSNEALATGADTSAVGADGRQSNTVGTVPVRISSIWMKDMTY